MDTYELRKLHEDWGPTLQEVARLAAGIRSEAVHRLVIDQPDAEKLVKYDEAKRRLGEIVTDCFEREDL